MVWLCEGVGWKDDIWEEVRNVVGEKYDGKLIIRSSQQGGRYHTERRRGNIYKEAERQSREGGDSSGSVLRSSCKSSKNKVQLTCKMIIINFVRLHCWTNSNEENHLFVVFLMNHGLWEWKDTLYFWQAIWWRRALYK